MQKMLCDAFLFKNVICVINSRMCLARQCLVCLVHYFFMKTSVKSEMAFGVSVKAMVL